MRIFEVFRQKTPGDQFVHVGEVEAPASDAALLAAKEHFARREVCSALWVVDRADVHAAYWDVEVLSAGRSKTYRRSAGLKAGRENILD
ncbi:MAG: paaB [Solirubrobacterales bacterium]|jgi:ring-1,2-phenylacetyl-CoA epoxidase subunit PaaB|nr:paaB [Solirubrobacterales bacterium]